MKKLFCALLALVLTAGVCLAESGTEYAFDDFTLTLPELSDAQFEDKADGAYILYGTAYFGGVPVVIECRYSDEIPETAPVEDEAQGILAQLNSTTAEQGFAVADSEVKLSEEITLGGAPAREFAFSQKLRVLIGFQSMDVETFTGMLSAQGGEGMYTFTASTTEPAALEAAMQQLKTLSWN